MLQSRRKSEGARLKMAARSTILRKNIAWLPDKSVPCPCEGQLCPLSTIYIIKGFLQKQGMEAVNWSVTNTKNISMPSREIASNEYDAPTKLSVFSSSLTPGGRKVHSGIITTKEILGLENNAICTCGDTISEKPSHRGKDVYIDEKSTEGVETERGKKREEYSKKGEILEKDLFKKPSKCWVEVDGNCKMRSVIRAKGKADNDEFSKRSTDIFSPIKSGVGANVKIFDDPKRDNEASGKKQEEDHGGENVTKRHKEGCPLFDSNSNINCRHRTAKSKNGKRADAIQSSKKVYPYVEKNEANSEFDDILKNRKDENSSASAGMEKAAEGADGQNANDSKEQIGRFNETSSIIAGFNKRYSRAAVSTKTLINQMNHRRLVKKFYGSFDSKRLQKNFTVNKLLDTATQPTVQNLQTLSVKKVLPAAKSAPSVRSKNDVASSNDAKYLSETRVRKGVRSANETVSTANREDRAVKLENISSGMLIGKTKAM
eukprot:Seg264.7 transcript_id=Seg264.7/GoldUCD/mRNA.D3Y31 product="hypothetical protein" protein_id=Seg264.7/GoldUCD/D3Y31